MISSVRFRRNTQSKCRVWFYCRTHIYQPNHSHSHNFRWQGSRHLTTNPQPGWRQIRRSEVRCPSRCRDTTGPTFVSRRRRFGVENGRCEGRPQRQETSLVSREINIGGRSWLTPMNEGIRAAAQEMNLDTALLGSRAMKLPPIPQVPLMPRL